MSMRSRRNGSRLANALIFTTTCGADDQFSSPKQIRWSAAFGKLLVANGGTTVNFHQRNADLSFHSKFYYSATAMGGIDADANNIYTGVLTTLSKWQLDFSSRTTAVLGNGGIRMIDASGDPDHVYVTSNNATDGHGVRKVRKSDMTVVASLLATGSGDGQFSNPLGVKYYGGFLYVADNTNLRIVKLNALDLSFVENIAMYNSKAPSDLDFDGTHWYIVGNLSSVYKLDSAFSYVSAVACTSYSLCIIPDQGDGNGQTLAITDSTNSHIARYKCSDLSQVGSDVGSSGTGGDTICDPQVTGPAGLWFDSEGGNYTVASAANISKNGFSGDFFKATGNIMRYRPTVGGLAAITAIDFNDDKISGEIKNLYKCVNLTSCKLQTNPALVLDLGRLSGKLTTIWAYACGSGIFGSIRHMTAATSINLRENGASQAQVDQWIGDLYANKDIMSPGTANFNGSNAAPSAAGKAQADELINDYAWSIAYTP